MGCCHLHNLLQECHAGTKKKSDKNTLNNKGPIIHSSGTPKKMSIGSP